MADEPKDHLEGLVEDFSICLGEYEGRGDNEFASMKLGGLRELLSAITTLQERVGELEAAASMFEAQVSAITDRDEAESSQLLARAQAAEALAQSAIEERDQARALLADQSRRIDAWQAQAAENDTRANAAIEERDRAREALKQIEAVAYEGANDLDDPLTPSWDCSAVNLPIINRNVERLSRIGDIASEVYSALSNKEMGRGR